MSANAEHISTLLHCLAREFSVGCRTPSPCCSTDAATKGDLALMELRIMAAISAIGGISDADKAVLDGVEARLEAMVKKFEQMDAQN